MAIFKQLLKDESGSVNSSELVLIMTLLVIGALVGTKSFRDGLVSEFADMAQAVANLDQSYSFSALTITLPSGGTLTTAGSFFTDGPDFCDTTADGDAGSSGSKCVNVCATAQTEDSGFVP